MTQSSACGQQRSEAPAVLTPAALSVKQHESAIVDGGGYRDIEIVVRRVHSHREPSNQ